MDNGFSNMRTIIKLANYNYYYKTWANSKVN